MALREQMELFEDGGLKQEGGMIDEVSGNDVPPGSTREEVRDDIPAQLSEGELVFPADVVRYIGLEKLMMLRQQAKQGLREMEAMGQMGNSDEATMPDDLPFDETDLDIEDDLEYNEGGVVYAPADFAGLMGGTPTGPQTQNVRYYNKQLRQVRMIPHFINPDGTIGSTIYPVPDGFVPQEEVADEPVEEKESEQKTDGQKDSGSSDGGDSTSSSLGGATTTIGGVDYAVQYNFDGTIGLQSIDNFNATGKTNFQTATPEIAEAVKAQTKGQLAQLGKVQGLGAVAIAEIGKKIGIETPKLDKLNVAIEKGKKATSLLNKTKTQNIFDVDKALKDAKFTEPKAAKVEDLTRAQVRSLDDAIRTGAGTRSYTEKEAADIARGAERASKTKDFQETFERQMYLGQINAEKTAAERKQERENIARQQAASKKAYEEMLQRQQDSGGSSDGSQSVSDQASVADQQGGMFTAVGGLIPKRKKITKKMKRGGLASKK